MPALVGHSSGRLTTSPTTAQTIDVRAVPRALYAAYARERLAEVIRAIAEDALNPNPTDVMPWHDEAEFDADLRRAVDEITEATTVMLTSALADLLETAPPRLVGRLATTPRFVDRP
jgi:hypothetical protein